MAMPVSRPWRLLAVFLAVASASVSLSRSTFTGAAADTSAYLAYADMWRRGELVRPVPAQLLPRLGFDAIALSPLGFRPGVITGTEVPAYPGGWPLLIAAADRFGPGIGRFVAGPVLFGLLAYATFWTVALVAHPLAGAFAAALVSALPVSFYHAIMPMSDVPAAALWVAAWWLSSRGQVLPAAASGLCAGIALLVRPNLAPLIVIPLVLAFRAGRRHGAPGVGLAFLATSGVGLCLHLGLQLVLYGSPLSSSYPTPEAYFSVANASANARNYLSLLHAHVGGTALVLTAIAAAAAILWSRGAALEAVRAAAAFVAINCALYIFYIPYSHWPFLRFFLPAAAATAIASALGWFALWSRASALPQRVAVLALALLQLTASATHRPDLWRYAWNDSWDQGRLLALGAYLKETLPRNSIVLGFINLGVVAGESRHNTLRLDLVDGTAFERLVDELTRHGLAPVLVLDQEFEVDQFRLRYAGTRFGALDWKPRARFIGAFETTYWRLSDHDSKAQWSTDVLRSDRR